MRTTRLMLALWLAAVLVTTGCGNTTVGPPDGALACAGDQDCQEGFRCQDGACVERPNCTDFDGDGFCDVREGYDDCNDNRANIHPGAEELCDGLDNDCDDLVDEDCPCNAGDSQACGSDVGVCSKGTQSCDDGQWGICQGGRQPAEQEECDDDLDNDCDGAVNNGCNCNQGDTRACGNGMGVCTPGVQTCVDQAGAWIWSACTGGTPPSDEICADGLDNDCDGSEDNGCACDEHSRPCGLNVGICHAGVQNCINEFWTACDGARAPEDEVCNGLDDDCDQLTDEGCECLDGQFEACGSNLGECSQGSRHCIRGHWDPCDGETPPSSELCDGRDNDCDGEYDEDFLDLLSACSAGVGICARPGAMVCSQDGSSTFCNASPGTGTDEFCNGLDDDCDGSTDEDFAGLGDPCSIGEGECYSSGVTTCDLGGGYQCNAAIIQPQAELCDGLDNSCDGLTDEVFPLGLQCSDGFGACYATGTWECSGDQTEAICNAMPGQGGAEECNGLDDDCDGETDELLSQPCSSQCGPGYDVCISGTYGSCSAPQPEAEICDGFDNNCDGATDEGFSLGGTCQAGVGLCLSLGYTVCNANGSGTTCNALAGTPQQEDIDAGYTCEDGIDNDCDGSVDGSDSDCDGGGCRGISMQDLYSLQLLAGGLGLVMFKRRRKRKGPTGNGGAA